MSSPYALPPGPTRRAESRTSIPPPDPRSRTVSPGFSSARAVGFPQPRDAVSASSGTSPCSPELYRFDVIGSHDGPSAALAPQQELAAPALARRAAWPYFSRTTALTVSVLIEVIPLLAEADLRGFDRSVPSTALGVEKPQQFFQGRGVGAVADERLLALAGDQLIDLELLEVMREGGVGNAGVGLDLAD